MEEANFDKQTIEEVLNDLKNTNEWELVRKMILRYVLHREDNDRQFVLDEVDRISFELGEDDYE